MPTEFDSCLKSSRRRHWRGHDGQRHRPGVRAVGLRRQAASMRRRRRSIARAATIEKSLGKFVEKGKLTAADRDAALGRLRDRPVDRRARRRRLRRRSHRRERRASSASCSAGSTRSTRPDVILAVEHLVDLDHDARRGHQAARQRARHALHEPGAADDARRADPRPGDVRRVDATSRPTCARRSARRRSKPPTTRASSPTAS